MPPGRLRRGEGEAKSLTTEDTEDSEETDLSEDQQKEKQTQGAFFEEEGEMYLLLY